MKTQHYLAAMEEILLASRAAAGHGTKPDKIQETMQHLGKAREHADQHHRHLMSIAGQQAANKFIQDFKEHDERIAGQLGKVSIQKNDEDRDVGSHHGGAAIGHMADAAQSAYLSGQSTKHLQRLHSSVEAAYWHHDQHLKYLRAKGIDPELYLRDFGSMVERVRLNLPPSGAGKTRKSMSEARIYSLLKQDSPSYGPKAGQDKRYAYRPVHELHPEDREAAHTKFGGRDTGHYLYPVDHQTGRLAHAARQLAPPHMRQDFTPHPKTPQAESRPGLLDRRAGFRKSELVKAKIHEFGTGKVLADLPQERFGVPEGKLKDVSIKPSYPHYKEPSVEKIREEMSGWSPYGLKVPPELSHPSGTIRYHAGDDVYYTFHGNSTVPVTHRTLAEAHAFLDRQTKMAKSEHQQSEGRYAPHEAIRQQATQYQQQAGLNASHPESYEPLNREHARNIASAYMSMQHQPNHPDVKASYDALRDETVAQYKAIRQAGLKVSKMRPGQPNPYPKGAEDLMTDVHRGHMWYAPTEGHTGESFGGRQDHPMLQPTSEVHEGKPMPLNDVFRIVHDYFGHAKEGVNFSPRGEEHAWRSHVRMYSPLAARAMTTETRGQSSANAFGPHGKLSRHAPDKTIFVNQKAGLMPDWAHQEHPEVKKSSRVLERARARKVLEKARRVLKR